MNVTTCAYSSVPCGPPEGGLPHTGFDVGFTVVAAVILVSLGLLLRRAARR